MKLTVIVVVVITVIEIGRTIADRHLGPDRRADGPLWARGHRVIIVGAHPYDPAGTEVTPMLLVAVGTVRQQTVGAAYHRQVDQVGVTGWITVNPRPMLDAPELAFVSQGWSSFPGTAIVDVGQLRALVTDYLETGRRPESVSWQESPLVR